MRIRKSGFTVLSILGYIAIETVFSNTAFVLPTTFHGVIGSIAVRSFHSSSSLLGHVHSGEKAKTLPHPALGGG